MQFQARYSGITQEHFVHILNLIMSIQKNLEPWQIV